MSLSEFDVSNLVLYLNLTGPDFLMTETDGFVMVLYDLFFSIGG